MKLLPRTLILVLCALATITASAEDRPPVAITRMNPTYPFELYKKKVAGYAVVEFVVETTGKPSELRVIEATHRDFEMSSLQCLFHWRFRPGVKDDVPVRVRMKIRFDFDPKKKKDANQPVDPTPVDAPSSSGESSAS